MPRATIEATVQATPNMTERHTLALGERFYQFEISLMQEPERVARFREYEVQRATEMLVRDLTNC